MAEIWRLQKVLSACGVASRRKSEEMIEKGRVTVNGKRAEIGDSVKVGKDIVAVDGIRVEMPKEKIYIALHKPRGFVTTLNDEKDRRCVADLVQDLGRVYPVGRLDKDSEGLLIMTNDGNFANSVMHPSRHIAKTYRVTVRPNINEDQLTSICTGIVIDGKKTAPAKAKVLEQYADRAVLEIVLYEGRNREIRKMCEALGLEVARLKRVAEGPVKLGMLKQGKYRNLTKEEIKGLMAESKKGTSKNDRDSQNEKGRNGSARGARNKRGGASAGNERRRRNSRTGRSKN